MRNFLLLFVLVIGVIAAEVVKVEPKYQKSFKCISCHGPIVKQWQKSWHAKSHFNNDEYFRKTLEYMGRKERRSLNAIKVECATCHNPRIAVTSTDTDYEIMAVMGLDKNSDVNKALADESIGEGINCVVCHNIDKIHDNLPEDKRGINRVTWMKSGIMSGPYNNAHSPYHKVEQRDFMDTHPDTLCFVCHANDKTVSGLHFTNMKAEYQKGYKSCVDCHMSPRTKGHASTLPIDNGKPKERLVRHHGFEGAHMQSLLEGALDLNLRVKNDTLEVNIINDNPHNIPSGFGAREIIVEAVFSDINSATQIQSKSLTQTYRSKRQKITIPHLGVKVSEDMSIPANGKRLVTFKVPKSASAVSIKLYYRLVNEQVHKLLDLRDPIWSRKTLINQRSKRF